MKNSPALGMLCDESTDAANLKQLFVFDCFLVAVKAQTALLKVVDLINGKAETTEGALLDVLKQPTFQ